MRSVNHEKHEKIAVFAFLITLLIAAGAFYYIWQVQARFGLTVEGARSLGEIMWKRQQLEGQQPAQLSQDVLAMKWPCCIFLQKTDTSLKINARDKGKLCYTDTLAQQLVKDRGFAIVDIEQGPYQK